MTYGTYAEAKTTLESLQLFVPEKLSKAKALPLSLFLFTSLSFLHIKH
jgi:hypothetical protein